jgi:glycosyltransferase involved in cell wall biosynthesis
LDKDNEKIMRILVFLPTYTLKIERGDTTHIKELVGNLSKFAEIDVIKANGIIASERTPSLLKALGVMLGLAKTAFLIQKRRPDIIYTRDSQSIFTFLLAKLFRLPMILEINGLFIDEWRIATRPSRMRRWISYIIGLLNEKTYKYADHLVVVTPKIKKVLEIEHKINPGKISVIENGANTDLFHPIDCSEARSKLQLSEDFRYVCFVGAFYNWQGLPNLIKCVPLVLSECPDTRFIIVGDGPAKSEIIELSEEMGLADKVTFTGLVPYSQVPLYIDASDICVVPKRPLQSGYSPLKLYEYMACGKPVVATRTDGFEVLEENRAGLLVNPEDPHEFASALTRLLCDPQLRKQMGENGRRYVVDNRSWESVARKVFGVCQTVVQKH